MVVLVVVVVLKLRFTRGIMRPSTLQVLGTSILNRAVRYNKYIHLYFITENRERDVTFESVALQSGLLSRHSSWLTRRSVQTLMMSSMYTSEFKDVAAGTLPAVVHPGGMVMPCRSRLGASFKLSRSCG